jgi:hypothetical protein
MGDRTWFRLEIRDDEVNKFKSKISDFEFLDGDIDDSATGSIMFEADEMNYGGQDMQDEMKQAGLTFMGEHGDGGGYDAYEFACFFGEFEDIPRTKEMGPVVPINSDGTISEEWLKKTKNYYRIADLVFKYFKRSDDPEFLRQLAIKLMMPKKDQS